jgi:hypothetical protein
VEENFRASEELGEEKFNNCNMSRSGTFLRSFADTPPESFKLICQEVS